MPSCPALMAATYPATPPPIIIRSLSSASVAKDRLDSLVIAEGATIVGRLAKNWSVSGLRNEASIGTKHTTSSA